MKNQEMILMKEFGLVNEVYGDIKKLIDVSKKTIYQTVNVEMLQLYWHIGKRIMEIQVDNRAGYGKEVLKTISKKLVSEYGNGFSERNLRNMRQFYVFFSIWQTVSAKLSWSHYLELIKIKEELKRNFYMQ